MTESSTCNGPENVCDGKNKKECAWTVPTEQCTSTPQCPTSNVCDFIY